MVERIAIALDAMGGDNAPDVVLAGANMALKRHTDLDFLLFGDEARIGPRLRRFRKLARVAEVRHTKERVTPEDKPSLIMRSGRRTSMRLAIDAVKAGTAEGVVSAGNTGALMAMSVLVLRTLEGIDRPAIASFFPNARAESVMLDLGANLQCDARNLVEFAVMGEVFARLVLGVRRPTIGLLNVGHEDTKGNEVLREAARQLRLSFLAEQFEGFVEGDDIPAGTVDLVVTGGFAGNVALKTIEGTAKLINGFLREAFHNSIAARIGYLFAKRSLDKLRVRTDPRRYNGAMFLGLNGVVVKSHGSADALGFATAIDVAVDMARKNICGHIGEEIAQIAGQPAGEDRSNGLRAAAS